MYITLFSNYLKERAFDMVIDIQDLEKSEFYCLKAKELGHKESDKQLEIIQEEKAKEKKSKKRRFFRR